jgi:hypothetical protein
MTMPLEGPCSEVCYISHFAPDERAFVTVLEAAGASLHVHTIQTVSMRYKCNSACVERSRSLCVCVCVSDRNHDTILFCNCQTNHFTHFYLLPV